MENLNTNMHLEIGLKKLRENKLFDAYKEFKFIIDHENKNFKANFLLGIVYAKQKKFLDAERQFKKSLEINPDNPDIFNNLGLIYVKINKFQESINSFKEAIKIKPNFITSYINLGLVYKDLGQHNDAEKKFLEVLELDAINFDAKINLAILYKDTSKVGKAETIFKNLIDQYPNNLIVLINYGNFLKNFGDRLESEKYFKKAIEINPNYFPAYNNLMTLYERTNQNIKLKEIIDKAKINFPENNTTKLYEGHYLYKIEDFTNSINILENINFEQEELKLERLKNFLLAKNNDKIVNIESAYNYFQKTNNISNQLKNKNINKNNALKDINTRFNYFRNNIDNSSSNLVKTLSPIFLIGFPRSGTTLLDTILRSHPEIDVIEEKPTTTDMLNDLHKFTNGNLNNLKNIKNEEIISLQKNYLSSLDKFINKNKSSKIIIDKMPLNIVYIGEIIKIFPNAKFILALRHPCDCVLSCFMQIFKLNDSMANFLSIEDSANIYHLIMKLWKQYTNSLKINYISIKYEDVITDFNFKIKELLNFLDLEWSDEVLKFYDTAYSRNLINTPSYDQVYKPIYSESVYRWKKYEDKLKSILPILKPWIDEFDY